jgi:adenosyl cobinamide kinase/adenosyl cobinamide phosphate guanylyltransferase
MYETERMKKKECVCVHVWLKKAMMQSSMSYLSSNVSTEYADFVKAAQRHVEQFSYGAVFVNNETQFPQ